MDDFKYKVGELMLYCQCIEHDIKMVYAAMLAGDFDVNYHEISSNPSNTIGMVVAKLERLDLSDGNPHLSEGDYELLKKIKEIRNHWAHSGFTEFIYYTGRAFDDNFLRQRRRLDNDCNRLRKLHESIE